MIEFGITSEAIKKKDDWYVIGRCVTDIRIGDRFTEFVPHRKVDSQGVESMKFLHEAESALPIDLIIVEIEAYGKILDHWSSGMTAGLTLRGDGVNLGTFGSLCGVGTCETEA